MSKITILKKASLTTCSFISLIINLILYIHSYELYKDEYGIDVSFSTDYLFAFVTSFIIFTYLLFSLFLEIPYQKMVYLSCSGLVSFYALGTFFKALFKALSKGNEFDFSSKQVYLYIGITVFFIFLYFLFDIIEKKENNGNTK